MIEEKIKSSRRESVLRRGGGRVSSGGARKGGKKERKKIREHDGETLHGGKAEEERKWTGGCTAG